MIAASWLQVAAGALVVTGVAFLLAGTIGLVRFPDVFARAHAASKCDSVGAGSVLLGVALHDGIAFADLKLVLLALLVVVSGPTTAHALARAALRSGRRPVTRDPAGPA